MDKETFADRLKAAMNSQGKKQIDLIRLASQQGVKLGKSHISQYVSGKTVPRADILRFLAEALQVEEGWLRGNAAPDRQASAAPDRQASAAFVSGKQPIDEETIILNRKTV